MIEDYIDCLCVVRRTTVHALQIEHGVGLRQWVPRSICENGHIDYRVGETPILKIWGKWAVERGIARHPIPRGRYEPRR